MGWISRLVMLFCLAFLARALFQLDLSQIRIHNPILACAYFLAATFIYLLTHLLVGYAWKLVLDYVGGRKIPLKEIYPVFLQSSAAKYVPGNVFEFVARNFLGSKYGWKQTDIALSSIIEAGLALIAFSIVIATGFATGWISLPSELIEHIDLSRFKLVALCATGAALLLGTIALYSPGIRNRIRGFVSWKFARMVGKFLTVDFLVFASSCALFAGILPFVLGVPLSAADLGWVACVFLTSSFAGYVVPGAPGGIGVREFVLVLLLAPRFDQSVSLMAALIYRVLGVIGDFLAYWVGCYLERRGRTV